MAITNGQTADADDINAELSALASDISALDSAAVKLTGNQTLQGVKTFSSIPVLPASDPTTDNQAARKAYIDGKFSVTPGDYLLLSADTERTSNSTSYAKVKEITLGIKGTIRIKFDMKAELSSGRTAYAKIYRNDVAVGTEQTQSNNVYTTKSEDISGWNIGDKLQLYIKNSQSDWPAYAKNLQLYASNVCNSVIDIN